MADTVVLAGVVVVGLAGGPNKSQLYDKIEMGRVDLRSPAIDDVNRLPSRNLNYQGVVCWYRECLLCAARPPCAACGMLLPVAAVAASCRCISHTVLLLPECCRRCASLTSSHAACPPDSGPRSERGLHCAGHRGRHVSCRARAASPPPAGLGWAVRTRLNCPSAALVEPANLYPCPQRRARPRLCARQAAHEQHPLHLERR